MELLLENGATASDQAIYNTQKIEGPGQFEQARRSQIRASSPHPALQVPTCLIVIVDGESCLSAVDAPYIVGKHRIGRTDQGGRWWRCSASAGLKAFQTLFAGAHVGHRKSERLRGYSHPEWVIVARVLSPGKRESASPPFLRYTRGGCLADVVIGGCGDFCRWVKACFRQESTIW
jgi:hypothetical protein